MTLVRTAAVGVMAVMVVCLLLTVHLPAAAGISAAVDLAEMEIDEALRPGSVYQLPALEIGNSGSQAGSYEVTATQMSDQVELSPAAGWLRFEPRSFALEPGASMRVAVSIDLPGDARSGEYMALIKAHPVAGDGGGAEMGVAATRLRFSVQEADSGFLQRQSFWLCFGLALVAAVGSIWLMRRLLPLRLRVERR